MSVTITQLHPKFAARIEGINIAGHVSETDFTDVRTAFEKYSVIVIHDQDIDDEQQMEFSKRFGDLEMMAPHLGNDGKPRHVSVMHNEDRTGKIIPPDDERMIYQSANMIWHSDSSFKIVPSLCSMLHARLLPPKGGETEFASMRAAYDSLEPDMKNYLENKVAIHDFANTRKMVGGQLSDWQKKNLPPVRQALIRKNPVTNRKAMFIGGHATSIEGMDEENGKSLLAQLLKHATQKTFVYSHHWKVGDLVIWDNRAVLHRGRTWDIANYKRILHRTTVAGDDPTV